MASKIVAAVQDFDFPGLLQSAVDTEHVYDGEGTEDDEEEGASRFEAIGSSGSAPPIIPTASTSPTTTSGPIPTPSIPSSSPPLVPLEPPPLRHAPIPNTANRHLLPLPPTRITKKHRPPSQITYQKARDKARRKEKKSRANKCPPSEFAPNLAERHISASSDIKVPGFNLSAKTPAKTAYVGLRDPAPNTRLYTLDQLVGKKSKEGFALIEWDGK